MVPTPHRLSVNPAVRGHEKVPMCGQVKVPSGGPVPGGALGAARVMTWRSRSLVRLSDAATSKFVRKAAPP